MQSVITNLTTIKTYLSRLRYYDLFHSNMSQLGSNFDIVLKLLTIQNKNMILYKKHNYVFKYKIGILFEHFIKTQNFSIS
jgi:hypothetical protein